MATLRLMCRCHLPPTMEQRQTIFSRAVEKNIKAIGVHGNIMVNVWLSVYLLQWSRDNVW